MYEYIISIFAHNHIWLILCIMNDYICLLEDYLGTIEGKMIKIKPIDRAQSAKLPLYILSSFRFFETKLLGNEVILACIEDGDDFAPLQMKKTLSIIEEKIGKPVVLAPQRLASYNQLRLVNQRVSFVIPGKQLFIPDLLVNLKKEENRNVDLGDTIPPMAQCMLLYHIQVKSIHGKNTQEVAEEFFVSYATINRAIRWLTKHKLIGLRGAKTKHIEISLPKREIWEQALPYLTSPVERVLFTDVTLEGGIKSGINALSKYTMLNPDMYDTYAVFRAGLKELGVVTDKQFGKNMIEVWRYDPTLMSLNGYVDKLSLYLSLINDKDERVQIELEHLLETIEW
ncbi:hypothetical protein IX299_001811 [Porphyromonas levii]|nr:hypothetical protein [Porphyromonas levii]